ncbi:hypothetical protein MTR67_024030 [Solanum verrucosum]|uniref:NB-ARC domain-containing protein n=1 Tax=Solanum verrucosum TaxID=315347 RepID=A0AAF0R0X5_SOLVR|nr:hypothetical protein MTR67_024030 [Solanum verrucosum]
MTEEQLDFLLLNLHHLSKYCAEQFFPSVTQYEILQNVCGNIRYFHGLIVNGYVEHGTVEYVLPQLQPTAEKVGLFLLNDQTDEDSRLFKLAHLLMKITPIELEVMHICYTNLKDSNSEEVECFIKQLRQTCTDILREYLIHLQEHIVTVVAPSFKEETSWIIRKLTSGPTDLAVISITGSGKTTLAYKVYNDKLVSSHFDIRAWCTVGQEYDENKLVDKIFNQVTGSDSKLSENVDVADKLRKQLYGKRYLIVFADLWDTATWDELTRPFPEVEKGSRIIFTTRENKVTLHGKCHSDPLNIRLLTSEESWEFFEERALGNESYPKELLDVWKRNCPKL